MTVAELIEELGKFPPHHRVFVEWPDYSQEVRHDGVGSDVSSVADIRADGDCCVILDATGGVQ